MIYNVNQLRAKLKEALDLAEKEETVIVVRGPVQFVIRRLRDMRKEKE